MTSARRLAPTLPASRDAPGRQVRRPARPDGGDLLPRRPARPQLGPRCLGHDRAQARPHGLLWPALVAVVAGARPAPSRHGDRDHAALRGERRVAPVLRGGPPRHARRHRHRRGRRRDRRAAQLAARPRKSRSTPTTNRWSFSCGSPETVTVPTTPTPPTITGNAPPWAANSRGSSR